MRTLPALPHARLLVGVTAASLLFVSGCGDTRNSMLVVPDRQGHAYTDNGSQGDSGRNVQVPGPGEMFITFGPKDTLTGIAAKYNTTVAKVIKRNDLEGHLPTPGTTLIVPNVEAPAHTEPASR